jgi:peptidoglycan/LPS O-acetylase OafA/YrhL
MLLGAIVASFWLAVELEFYLWKRTWCASGVPHHLCDEFAFDWAYVEVQQPKRRGSQVRLGYTKGAIAAFSQQKLQALFYPTRK